MVDPNFPQNLTHHSVRNQPTDGEGLVGMDAYSADGHQVGRVSGYLDQVPENTAAFQPDTVDVLPPDGEPAGPRRLLVDGQGFATQAEIAVPEDQVTVDVAGRRVTLALTLDQLLTLPRHQPS